MIIDLQGVTKNYGRHCALSSLDFSVGSGQVVALLGANGAGKTTTVKLMLGLLKPDNGKVRILDGDPTSAKTREKIGAMLQAASMPETLRVREHIDLFSSYYPKPLALDDTLERTGLSKLAERYSSDLSGGEQRRLLFALAICGDPALMFLDEPTTGLDIAARRALWSQIRQLRATGKTVLLTTHYLEEADQLADRIVVLKRGKIVADGTPAEIKRAGHSDEIEDAFLNLTDSAAAGQGGL